MLALAHKEITTSPCESSGCYVKECGLSTDKPQSWATMATERRRRGMLSPTIYVYIYGEVERREMQSKHRENQVCESVCEERVL